MRSSSALSGWSSWYFISCSFAHNWTYYGSWHNCSSMRLTILGFWARMKFSRSIASSASVVSNTVSCFRDRWTHFQSAYLLVPTPPQIRVESAQSSYSEHTSESNWTQDDNCGNSRTAATALNRECSVLMSCTRFHIFREVNSHNEHW